MASPIKNPGSFRDPAGFVFSHDGTVYRQVNLAGQEDYDHLISSGLYKALTDQGLMVAHTELNKSSKVPAGSKHYKTLQPEPIPFISYPYEWSFEQLKDAALLTLQILKVSLEHGMILKDASAYNIQFIGNKPVFIDTLSFALYKPGQPWEGYKQFCEHFLAPLALSHYATPDLLRVQRSYLDGIPLGIAARLLPQRARLNAGVFSHIFLHARASQKHQGNQVTNSTSNPRQVSTFAMQGLIGSLESNVRKLRPANRKTEWGDYYSFTNYSDKAFTKKRAIVKELLEAVKPKPLTVWDTGANNGEFSEVAAEMGAYTIALDIDEIAVGRNYKSKRQGDIASRMLPLVQDLTNPSPGIGWSLTERSSIVERGKADVVMSLALIHHIAIGNNVPFAEIASFYAKIARNLIIEFVPKEDSKVQILLSSRTDIFDEYDSKHFEAAMGEYFTITKKVPIEDSKRTMYLFKNKKN